MRNQRSTLSRPCALCATPFFPYRGKGKYCSRLCSGKASALRPRRPVADRFWEKVDKNGPIPPHRPELGPCWLWTGARLPDGRGQFHLNGRTEFASVVAYLLTYGPLLPEKPWVLHHCDGGRLCCVCPGHLFAGTHTDNMRDMAAKGRQGTNWTPENRHRLARGERHGTKTHPDSVTRGSRRPTAKLTEAIVIDARLRRMAGLATTRQLAEEAGVSWAIMHKAIRRESWKHVT
jgi:hypothetical protein